MRFSKKKPVNYSKKRLINLIGEDKNTLNLEAKNVQNIQYTLASEDNETSHILNIDEQGNAYINAKEEDLATFSILDNPYSLYWGSSSETGDTSYSYKPITESLNITKGAVVEPLELKKLHKISYQFYNNREAVYRNYTIDVTIKGFDTPIRIIEENAKPGMTDISNHFENYLCIDIDNFQPFKLYLSHKDDEAQAIIDFDISSVSNFEQNQKFYFDCNSLLWAEPFTTANFDKYLEYYKNAPVFNEAYRILYSGFKLNDIKNITQVIPDDAEDSQYVETYRLFQRAHSGNVNIVKKFANLTSINFSSDDGTDFSDTTIYLPDNQPVDISIETYSYNSIIPPYYENVSNVFSIDVCILNYSNNISDFNLSSDYRDNKTAIEIQQTASDYSNALAPKIQNLRISSGALSNIKGNLTGLENLRLDINDELPNNFSLRKAIPLQTLRKLDLSFCSFKNIPHDFLSSSSRNIEILHLSDDIENIGENAFVLNSLALITIPENLKTISSDGFIYIGENGNITSLDFRNTKLETLERGSLRSTANLKIYLPTTVTTICSDVFGPNTTVYYNGTAEGAPWGAKEVITEF